MDALPYVDALIKEYLLFRGFTSTLSAFTKDLAADPGCGFQAERITELLFRQLIPALDCEALVEFLEYLNMQLYSRLDSRHEPLVSAVEADLLRLFLVTAHNARRPDKMADFFRLYGPQLISNSSRGGGGSGGTAAGGGAAFGPGQQQGVPAAADWREWFVLPYLQHPEKEPRFQLYFSSEWAALLEVSFRNFIAGVVRSLPLPAVLRFNTDRRLRHALQQQVHALQSELARTQQQLGDAQEALQQGQQQQHRREASLGDWQQQRAHRTAAGSLGGAGPTDSGEAEAEAGLQEPSALKPVGGSGLFELLPQHSGVLGAGSTGSQAAAGLQQQQAQQQQPQGLPRHLRGASFGGSISFDTLSALAAGDSQADELSGSDAALLEQPDSTTAAVQLPRSSLHQPTQQPQQQSERSGRPIPQPARGPALPPAPAVVTSSLPPGSAASPVPSPTQPRSSSTATGAPLSSSPILSWAGGSGSTGMMGARPRHVPTGHASTAAAAAAGGAVGGSSSGSNAVAAVGLASLQVVSPVSPVIPRVPAAVAAEADSVTVTYQTHQGTGSSDAGSVDGAVTAVAFSPSGGNVASVIGGSSSVHIWSPAGLPGSNAARTALVGCGAPATCVAWDSRADKLMLIGCAGAGGVRAWHADTRRIMDTVPADPGFPVVAAVAACPSEPAFVVAANSSSGSGSGGPLQGRLVTYNARSFKRSSVLSVPGDTGLASVAYSSSGSQLLVGTTAGTALLYEPNSRSSPVRLWQVAAAVLQAPGADAGAAVQVLWRPPAQQAGGGSSGGSMLTLCRGVLCEWLLSTPSSQAPVRALDVAAAAKAVAGAGDDEQQCFWHSSAAVSPDGSWAAVLCAAAHAGALLLLPLRHGGEPGTAHVLLQGSMLACSGSGGGVSFHPAGGALVVGCDGGSVVVSLPPDLLNG